MSCERPSAGAVFADGWLRLESPAKINLFLEVLGRRPDGYHELVTEMACISLADRLAFRVTADGSAISGWIKGDSGPAAGKGEQRLPDWHDNLVNRALDLLRRESGITAGMEVRLEKRIPLQAGLGGGSSNAATALIAGNRLWNLCWPRKRLILLAARLGSDVPFFLAGGRALCRGRGERVEPLSPRLGLPVVVMTPPEGLATPRVFAELGRNREGEIQTLPNQPEAGKAGALPTLFNRLEQPAASLSAWPARLRQAFDAAGCRAHQLSGSGSAWFGLFATPRMASRAARMLAARWPETQVDLCRTVRGIGVLENGEMSTG